MKRIVLATFTIFLATSAVFAQSVTWKLNNLKKIGRHKVEILGQPQILETDKGEAILFDGIDDGIFIENNPIAGSAAFTIEAEFRPDAGGSAEQRWLHIEDLENVGTRALLETRLSGNEWFVDTFLKSGENCLPLYAEKFRHPVGKWYTVALVYDGSEMRHYVDGVLELSGEVAVKPFGKGRISFGVRQNKVYWFKGAIRRTRFSLRALSPHQLLR